MHGIPTPNRFPVRPALVGIMLALPFAFVLDRAQAGGGHYYPPVVDPQVAEECGGCHLAFPPSMLPARSWQRMMGELGDHFGDDASLPPDVAQRVERYLVDGAADRGGQRYAGKWLRGLDPQSAPLRITAIPKWVREHDEVPRSDWSAPDVLTKANCAACHLGAERGYYDD